MFCVNDACRYSDEGFPLIGGQPVLIDFADSIFQRANYTRGTGSAIRRDDSALKLKSRLHRAVNGGNPVAARNCETFIALLKSASARPLILVVGGGVVGLGADRIYADPAVDLIGTDVYASATTDLLCDAHKLPFDDDTFDGVWIQAVLEHVLDPAVVVGEVRRVLKADGLVYAETPFMQQVHEHAYDFTRFTRSGHRWLFRHFDEISSGPVTGPAVALLWSMRYLARALGAGEKLSRVVPLVFFWIRYLDRICRPQRVDDAAGGVFFLGRRSDNPLPAAAMVNYYEQRSTAARQRQRRWRPTGPGAECN